MYLPLPVHKVHRLREDVACTSALTALFPTLNCVQRILRYVSGTKDRGLLYHTGVANRLVGYPDVDWAENIGDRRSTSAFSLGSATITWNSKQQPTVAMSNTEVEYRGAAVTTCEAIWMKSLLKNVQVEVSDTTTIYYDNLSNI